MVGDKLNRKAGGYCLEMLYGHDQGQHFYLSGRKGLCLFFGQLCAIICDWRFGVADERGEDSRDPG